MPVEPDPLDHASRQLAELLNRRQHVARLARYDHDARADLDALDNEILECQRHLGRYCSECGHVLVLADDRDVCGWSGCSRWSEPNNSEAR